MKQLFILLTISAFVFTACGGGDSSNKAPKTAADARQQLQAKKEALVKIQQEIVELEKQLALLDTTVRVEKKILVTTQPVLVKTFEHFVEVQGNVATSEDPAMASSETGGRIIEMNIKEGDYVKKGDLIAKVNLESIQKTIDEINTSLKLAQDMFSRQENLWKQNIGSEVQYLQAKTQVESLMKTKERLEYELKKANVFAPASGTVEMVMAKAGEMCGPGTPILQIINSSTLKVIASVPEIYLPSVRKGDGLRVTFPALLKEQQARVSAIGRIVNPTNRTFEVEALVNNEGGLVKPNLLATVFIKDYEHKNSVVVPAELIMQDVTGANYVMVSDQNKAAKRIVTLGKSYMNQTEILSGLTGKETIIVKGARQVVEGDALELEKEVAVSN